MKYLRKIIWLVIAVVFLASVIIGVGIIFAVKNVNVTLENYTYSSWEEMTEEETQAAEAEVDTIKDLVMGKYRGKLISTVSSGGLSDALNDSNYILESCEKVYPCTLNITVRERREVFSMNVGSDSYNTYDSLGRLMRSGVTAEEAVNNLDKAPNIEIFVNNQNEIAKVVAVSQIFSEEFSALRSMVKEISTVANTSSNMKFELRCGLMLEITDYEYMTRAKIKALYNKFISLSADEKLSPDMKITVVVRNSGEVYAEYWSRTL